MRVLLVVDVLNDFAHPKGSMYTPGGETISRLINQFEGKFDYVVIVRDLHPENHKCFASNNPGTKVLDVIDLNGVKQVMWYDHCVKGTWGAELFKELKIKHHYVQYKGRNPELDSYSAFVENDGKTKTGLADYLKKIGATEVYVVGLATDCCIKYTVLDAISEGFNTYVIVDAIRGINVHKKDSKKAMHEMLKAGATLIDSKHILEKGFYQLFDDNGEWISDLTENLRESEILIELEGLRTGTLKYTWRS